MSGTVGDLGALPPRLLGRGSDRRHGVGTYGYEYHLTWT